MTDLVITSCDDHGVKVESADVPFALESFATHVEFARQHEHAGPGHDDQGGDCWVCCESMVIDPHGVLD